MVEPTSRFSEVKIPLGEPVHGLSEVSGVIGVPRWWPTGSRVSVVIAHDSGSNMDDPLIEYLQRELTERRNLTLRFNFPFAEAKKRRSDSPTVLRRAFRAAIGSLVTDPTAVPAHLFIGGLGIGGQTAAVLSGMRVRVDGLFLLGFPLHPQGKPEKVSPEILYRVVAPLLFLQGSRDRNCEIDVLRRALSKVGAPTSLFTEEGADHRFRVLKKSSRPVEDVHLSVLHHIDAWIQKVLAT